MSETSPPSAAELAAAYRAGDTDAFAAIYDEHSSVVFSFFLANGRTREEAADATNEVFGGAADRLDRGETPDDFGSWLLGLAARHAGVEPEPPDEVVPAPPALRPRVLDRVEREVAATMSIGTQLDPEWVRLGAFGLVTVIVGLIGFLVSSRFEPLDPLPTVPTTSGPVAEATTTTTFDGVSTTVPDDEPSSSTTAAPAPASLQVAPETIDFGDDGTVNEFEVANSGGSPGTFRVEASTEAIALSTGEAEVAAGETVAVQLALDREEIEEGDIEATITVTWEGGSTEISVTGSHEANPIIHNPQASPSSVEVAGDDSCSNTMTTVSARVRDTSPLESVVVRWSPDGGAQRETEMASVGNDMFRAEIGPFTTAQTAQVRIVAFDERGNAGGASATVSVVACP